MASVSMHEFAAADEELALRGPAGFRSSPEPAACSGADQEAWKDRGALQLAWSLEELGRIVGPAGSLRKRTRVSVQLLCAMNCLLHVEPTDRTLEVRSALSGMSLSESDHPKHLKPPLRLPAVSAAASCFA